MPFTAGRVGTIGRVGCSLTFVGAKVWSSIPDYIKSSTTFTFKWKLKKHLLLEKDT